jgi:hypothetical protein
MASKFTLKELKEKNPLFFDKKTMKFMGVYKQKLMQSTKLGGQVLVEAAVAWGGNRVYSVRKVSAAGSISAPVHYDTLREASLAVGKNIVL